MKKRESNTQSLKSVLERYVKQFNLEDKLGEVELINSWEKEMGKVINNHTKQIFVKNKILFVKLDSAIVRNELSYAKEKIVSRLNNRVGKIIIDKIVLS